MGGGLELGGKVIGRFDGKIPHVGDVANKPRLQLLVRDEAVDLLLKPLACAYGRQLRHLSVEDITTLGMVICGVGLVGAQLMHEANRLF